MFVFFGDYDKYDWVLAVASALSVVKQKEVTIVTDDLKSYKYFEGEISGIKIVKSNGNIKGLSVYDCRDVIIPDLDNKKVILCTDMTRNSIDSVCGVYSKVNPTALVIANQDSPISIKYIETQIRPSVPVYTYEHNERRKIELAFDGRVRFKTYDDKFLKTLGKFLVDHAEVPSNQLGSLWRYLRGKLV